MNLRNLQLHFNVIRIIFPDFRKILENCRLPMHNIYVVMKAKNTVHFIKVLAKKIVDTGILMCWKCFIVLNKLLSSKAITTYRKTASKSCRCLTYKKRASLRRFQAFRPNRHRHIKCIVYLVIKYYFRMNTSQRESLAINIGIGDTGSYNNSKGYRKQSLWRVTFWPTICRSDRGPDTFFYWHILDFFFFLTYNAVSLSANCLQNFKSDAK